MSYYTLIASLPHLPPHYDVERLPISRSALSARLRLLREDDQFVLRQLVDFLAWDRQPFDRTDEEVVSEYDRLQEEIRHKLVLQIIDLRINVRTLVGALRRRRDESGPPIGVGPLVEPIRRAWSKPHFGLERQFPWIVEFEEHLKSGEAMSAQRVLFDYTWTTWRRMAADFTFSFEAVLLYIARWSIVDRWTSCDAEVGRNRFDPNGRGDPG